MPRTLAQNAQYIAETIKPAIKSAIEAQGVTVPSTDSFLDYADRIAEIEGGGSGYQLKDLPTGSISTVNDAAELPLNALKVSVEAWQEGSGDPSPSNIRPIHGWDSGEIGVVGKNWFDKNDSTIQVNQRISTGNGNTYASSGSSVSGYIEVFEGISYTLTTGRTAYYAWYSESAYISGGSWSDGGSIVAPTGATRIRFDYPTDNIAIVQFELGSTATAYEPYQGKQYTLDFPQTIYGAEWDVVDGSMAVTHSITNVGSLNWEYNAQFAVFISFGNGKKLGVSNLLSDSYKTSTAESLTGMQDNEIRGNTTYDYIYIKDSRYNNIADFVNDCGNVEIVFEKATPTTIDLSPLSIRLLEGTNNLYADCGDIIEGEYFVDEGAIDVRKVDYSIGSNSALKISDGRILQGFVNMSNYGIFPRDASNNWLDVDWSKSFEIGIAFKYTVADTNQTLFGSGISGAQYYKCPMIMLHPASQQFEIDISATGNSWDMTMSQTVTYASLTINTWYFLKMTFDQSTMSLVIQVSDDFSTWDTLLSITMSAAYYHDAASLCFGGFVQNSSFSSNNLLIDTFNTYIKGDGVNWGAFTGAFPS